MHNNKSLRYDLEVQRRDVWSLKQKQDFIHSIIVDYYIPPIIFVDKKDDNYWVLDGQQRCRAISEFINNMFALANNINAYLDEETRTAVDIKGKKYSELHNDVQTKINSSSILTYTFSNITQQEIEEMFIRLNSGTAFKPIELIRVEAGTDVTSFINGVMKMPFFSDCTKITERANIHFTDYEVVLQSLMVVTNDITGFGEKNLKKFVLDLKSGLLTKELKEKMIAVTKYIEDAFPEQSKYMKKVNIPCIFKIAVNAMDDDIHPTDFFDCVNTYFDGGQVTEEYKTLTKSGSAKKSNIMRRIEILDEYFNKNLEKIQNAGEPEDYSEEKVKNFMKILNIEQYSEESLYDDNNPLPFQVNDAYMESIQQ
jgi:hypothetical protein